jgi:hypothetical protein
MKPQDERHAPDRLSTIIGKYMGTPYGDGFVTGGPYKQKPPGEIWKNALDCTSFCNAVLSQFLLGSVEKQKNISGMNASQLFDAYGGVRVKDNVPFNNLTNGLDITRLYGVDWSGKHAMLLRHERGEWVSYESSSRNNNEGVDRYSLDYGGRLRHDHDLLCSTWGVFTKLTLEA